MGGVHAEEPGKSDKKVNYRETGVLSQRCTELKYQLINHGKPRSKEKPGVRHPSLLFSVMFFYYSILPPVLILRTGYGLLKLHVRQYHFLHLL